MKRIVRKVWEKFYFSFLEFENEKTIENEPKQHEQKNEHDELKIFEEEN